MSHSNLRMIRAGYDRFQLGFRLLSNRSRVSDFAWRIYHRRVELNMTQSEMIERLNRLTKGDLGRTTASVWENGHAEPSRPMIVALARVLHLPPEYLAFGVRVEEPIVRSLKKVSVPIKYGAKKVNTVQANGFKGKPYLPKVNGNWGPPKKTRSIHHGKRVGK